MSDMMHDRYIHMAIELAMESVNTGGGPFGAVIVRNGNVVATGVNRVTVCNDPTAHAEVNAIRDACMALGTFNLKGCVLYASCEPCPMCLGAIYWAHLDKVYYAAGKNDAADAGFDDSFIYKELELPMKKRSKAMEQLDVDAALAPFKQWMAKNDKTRY